MGKSKSKSTSTTTTKPPDWASGMFEKGISGLNEAYNKPLEAYQGDRVLGSYGEQTTNAQNRIKGQADALGNATTSSRQNLGEIASGQNNPYFNESLSRDLRSLNDSLTSQFSAQGLNDSATASLISRNLSDSASKAISDQWNKSIEQQLAANSQIDSADRALDQARLSANQQDLGAGLLTDDLKQKQLDANLQKHNEEQMLPWLKSGLYGQGLRGLTDGYGTTTVTQKGSSSNSLWGNIAGAAGGALSAASGMGGLFGSLGSWLGNNSSPYPQAPTPQNNPYMGNGYNMRGLY